MTLLDEPKPMTCPLCNKVVLLTRNDFDQAIVDILVHHVKDELEK